MKISIEKLKEMSSQELADLGGTADEVVKANTKILDDVKKVLRERGDNLPADETTTAAGEAFTVTVGKVRQIADTKSVANSTIISVVGQDVFNERAAFPITALKEVMTKADFEGLVEFVEGARSVSFKRVDD
jgi:hypothetical protein